MATSETRQAFEQLLKQAERKNARKNGKKMATKETEIVENLERSLTKDDPLLESNTFNGEADKNLKNLRNSELSKGKENKEADYITTSDKDVPKKLPRQKKKKVKLKQDKSPSDHPEDSLNKTDTEKPVKKPRSPKKDTRQPQDDIHQVDQTNEIPRPIPSPRKLPELAKAEAPAAGDDATEQTPKTTVKRKRRTKKRSTPRAQPVQESVEEAVEETEEAAPETTVDAPVEAAPAEEPSTFEDDGTILGITIHYCDHLRADLRYVAHPVVRVSVVDSLSGNFLNKVDSSRRVSSFYEDESVNCILPLMTQPFDFKTNRSILPRWEEMLVFNEPFRRLTYKTTDPAAPRPVLFFVIRDFVTMAKVNNRRDGGEKGWHNVAWAFLKLVNANGKPNAGRKMRLQLFYPPRGRTPTQGSNVEVAHDWWLNHSRQRYPATLYVTVKAVIAPSELSRSSRSMNPTQPEEGALTFNELNQSLEQAESEAQSRAEQDDLAAMQQWSRLPGQTCKIPNAPFLRFWAGSEGSFTLQFSHRGTRLAAAGKHEEMFPIIIYSIPGGEDVGVITGHQQLVYDLQWSKNDRYLLSSSADGTAQVWDVERHEKPVHTLPHPCYVYTATFHPVAQYLIASGGYDTTVRIWNIASVTQLTQELTGHKAIINSIIFDQTGLNMYSADGIGVIICWNCPAYEKAKKRVKTNWSIKMKIEDRDLAGICINSLRLHPHNNKILIHCRDSTVRILDARIHSMKKFTGLLNHRQLLRSSVTPCGTFIFSGSEDGYVYVWNAETGDQVAIYNELGFTSAVHAVVYHPHDHMVAFCSFASSQPILIYKFNSDVATMEVGLPGFQTLDGALVPGRKEEGVPSIGAHIEASKAAVKLERIRHQLDSVLVDSLNLSGGNTVLPPLPRNQDGQVITPIRSPRSPYGRQNASFAPMSTWGSTFDSTTQIGTQLAPSYLSPHASPEARAMAQQYAKSGYADASPTGWRPNVAAVGGSPYRTQMAGIPPDVSFGVDETGKQMLNVSSTPGAQQQSIVVALFDYQANRSDELTIVRGDIIRVFFKDSSNWWFGERTSDKRQGYFPSNYVEEQVSTAAITQSDVETPRFGMPEPVSNKKVHALKMPGGRLQFYSQSESDGDDERLSNASFSSRQRRRAAKSLAASTRKTEIPLVELHREPLSQSPDATFPKSILQKTSPRPKIVVQAPSTEATNIKEVSFADEKKTPQKADAKQELIESIQAQMEAAGVEALPEPAKDPSPTATPRRTVKPKPKAVSTKPKSENVRKTSPRLSRGGHAETSFGDRSTKTPDSPTTATTPTLHILKSVQALMNKKENESSFSHSVLDGHDVGTPKPHARSGFQPPVHSTAMKQQKYPVENEDASITPGTSQGSVVRKARPLPKIRKFADEEAIPMVDMSDARKGRSSPSGLTNPAFDSSA